MNAILSQYDENKKTCDAYAKSLESLIGNLLSHNNIKVHSISARVKEKDSLVRKIARKDSYSHLDDITDIIGIRIITHYSDEVDSISKIIEAEFSIDTENSIDKRKTLEPDRFGYLSLHYVISLSEERSMLTEYSNFKNLKAELQIRSILQHTWAEIEHDIGYKSGVGVPHEVRRQFSRLAGLLELGDSEFINIREKLKNYEERVSLDIKNNATEVMLDKISILEYSKSSDTITEICLSVKEKFNLTLTWEDTEFLNLSMHNLEYINVKTISELDELIKLHKENIIKKCGIVAKRVLEKNNATSISGTLIFIYLTQSIVAREGERDEIREYIDTLKIRNDNIENFITELIETFSQ
ncbi:GTP pyrophosphokinase [Serratia proteamaculans]|uniref:GTP pyrophosphokinase n=1 Tax=Serratia proteamaculans TaxID=28151 RepID=UPI00217896F5|nr:hypothetical protein [Serratia proteamaculans]CAI0887427.1 GTP pyrophosphokinase ywaC [Serratia proteamaculans]CAI1056262.1 GTP pyrophosphokinase ywaC [Serratia proteamaculans]